MKILIFGNSGSGKSTLARHLAQEHTLAHLDLDSIVWEPGRIASQRTPGAIAASLASFLASHEQWVIEGCYGEVVQAASRHCSELIFLNPGKEACLEHNRRRPWEPHKYASKQEQDAMLENLQAWVSGYYERQDQWSYHAHRRIFDAFAGRKSERQVNTLIPLQASSRTLVILGERREPAPLQVFEDTGFRLSPE